MNYVMAQKDFWADIEVMRKFQNFLEDKSRFEVVKHTPTQAPSTVQDKEIVIYRNLQKTAKKPEDLTIELVEIGKTFKGKAHD